MVEGHLDILALCIRGSEITWQPFDIRTWGHIRLRFHSNATLQRTLPTIVILSRRILITNLRYTNRGVDLNAKLRWTIT